jgi:DNA-binding NarL/FixJ family response regulator
MPPENPGQRTRILIVDDHPAVCESLAAWIGRQSDLEFCGAAAELSEALRLVTENSPELVVVDISLKAGDGIELIKRIRDRAKSVRMLVWSSHSEALYAERCLRAGAMGYVQKDQAMEQLMQAIRRVLQGKMYLSEAMTERMLRRNLGSISQAVRSPVEALADRELEVLRLVGQGTKTAEIARRLHLSVHTVETYRERIKSKLDLKNGAELSHFATQWVLENA